MAEQQVVVATAEVGCSSTSQSVFAGVPLCTLLIPNTPLLSLRSKKSGYVDGVKESISGKTVTLNRSVCRLEAALQKIAGKLASNFRKCK